MGNVTSKSSNIINAKVVNGASSFAEKVAKPAIQNVLKGIENGTSDLNDLYKPLDREESAIKNKSQIVIDNIEKANREDIKRLNETSKHLTKNRTSSVGDAVKSIIAQQSAENKAEIEALKSSIGQNNAPSKGR